MAYSAECMFQYTPYTINTTSVAVVAMFYVSIFQKERCVVGSPGMARRGAGRPQRVKYLPRSLFPLGISVFRTVFELSCVQRTRVYEYLSRMTETSKSTLRTLPALVRGTPHGRAELPTVPIFTSHVPTSDAGEPVSIERSRLLRFE